MRPRDLGLQETALLFKLVEASKVLLKERAASIEEPGNFNLQRLPYRVNSSRCEGEVKSWSQVSERLRGLFCELVEEDDGDMDTLDAPCGSPFSSVLSPMVEESPVAKEAFEEASTEGTECDVQDQVTSHESPDEDEVEAEPEPM
ncbi:hypothetical protein AK812_SmicGene32748 [Symbiodinium microadriaticum]|uniref:Uncharacterized protein n=1 Tax=Symbiodinium microadriaticum TaxID=2951 RepID=A0A1Q9CTF0_SYMMI|nr:hypothetical protein AK812_SmicGene32748 [Symbiodinium microadriaticum]